MRIVLVLSIFIAGILFRVAALNVPRESGGVRVTDATRWAPADFQRFLEQDEKIYLALVDQLDSGKGYTLQGHPILQERWIVGEQYGHALFFHPPGGVALFWVAHRIAGDAGYPLVQVVCFALFFWALIWLGQLIIRPLSDIALLTTAVLAAMTPLMAFVAGRFWLDGPLLAFSTLAAALFLHATARGSRWLVAAAGIVLGYATLIKITAVLIAPGVVVLAWALRPRGASVAPVALSSAIFLGTGFVVQLPWEIWQWIFLGSPFPAWAGRPATRLVQTNQFVCYQTVVRTAWVYIELLPQVMFTLVPGIVLWAFSSRVRDSWRVGLGLLVWIGSVVGAHMMLGAMGYSKILRYIVLVTPAVTLLFALGLSAFVDRIRGRGRLGIGAAVLLAIALAAVGLEIAQGVRTSLHDNARTDMLHPLMGMPIDEFRMKMLCGG